MIIRIFFDIFKTKYNNNAWTKPENVGFPYNSNADDYYFTKNKSKSGGFLVSNRIYGKEKTVTTNEDIFEFSSPNKTLAIRGQVLQKENSSALKDIRITLYEVMSNTQKRLLQSKPNSESDYEFALLPDKKYRLEAEKKGFKTTFYEFSTLKTDSTANGISYNIYLENQEKSSGTTVSSYIEDSKKPVLTTTTAAKPTAQNTSTKPATASEKANPQQPVVVAKPTATPTKTDTKPVVEKPIVNAPKTDVLAAKGDAMAVGKGSSQGLPLYEIVGPNSEHLLTSAPKQKGTYYKIQILATKEFSIEEPRYRSVRDLGRMDTEYIIGKGLSRVLLADFFMYEDAERLLPQVQQNKEFKTAYIVKYQDGERIGTGK